MQNVGISLRRAVRSFAAAWHVPLVMLGKTDRKHEANASLRPGGWPALVRGARDRGCRGECRIVFATSQREDRGWSAKDE